MSRSGVTYALEEPGGKVRATGLATFNAPVAAAEAARVLAGTLKREHGAEGMAGCRLRLAGAFGQAEYDVVIEDGRPLLRKVRR